MTYDTGDFYDSRHRHLPIWSEDRVQQSDDEAADDFNGDLGGECIPPTSKVRLPEGLGKLRKQHRDSEREA